MGGKIKIGNKTALLIRHIDTTEIGRQVSEVGQGDSKWPKRTKWSKWYGRATRKDTLPENEYLKFNLIN